MASTFTLKRKTYTEFDYHNDIATKGFSDGFFTAYEKLFASIQAEIAERINKGGKGLEWFGTRGAGRDDVNRALRGKLEDYYGKKYHQGFLDHVKSEYSRLSGGGQQVKGKFPPGTNPSAPQLQQRAASFIGKGYLY